MDTKQLNIRTQKALSDARRALMELDVVCRKQQTVIAAQELRAAKREEELAELRLRSYNQQGRLDAMHQAAPRTGASPSIKASLKTDHPIERIKKIVLEVCCAPAQSFTANGRKFYDQSWPRRLAMYLCYEVYMLGTSDTVAKAFHKTDHGTTLYACRSVKNDIEVSKPKMNQFLLCKQRCDEELKVSIAS